MVLLQVLSSFFNINKFENTLKLKMMQFCVDLCRNIFMFSGKNLKKLPRNFLYEEFLPLSTFLFWPMSLHASIHFFFDKLPKNITIN
jgi:hypothetical protein